MMSDDDVLDLCRSFDLGKLEMDLSAGVVDMGAKKIRRGCVKLHVMFWYWGLPAAAYRAIFRACIRLKHELTRSFDLGKLEMDLSAGVVGTEAKKIRRGSVKVAVMLWYWGLLAAASRAIFRTCIRLKHELTRLLENFVASVWHSNEIIGHTMVDRGSF